jgi:hypothetical protein
VGKSEERDKLEDLGEEGMIIWNGRSELDLAGWG